MSRLHLIFSHPILTNQIPALTHIININLLRPKYSSQPALSENYRQFPFNAKKLSALHRTSSWTGSSLTFNQHCTHNQHSITMANAQNHKLQLWRLHFFVSVGCFNWNLLVWHYNSLMDTFIMQIKRRSWNAFKCVGWMTLSGSSLVQLYYVWALFSLAYHSLLNISIIHTERGFKGGKQLHKKSLEEEDRWRRKRL